MPAKSRWNTLLDEFWDKNEVGGGGTSLPTAILYLHNPDSYAIWIPALEDGIKKIFPTLKLKKRRTAEGYQVYNEAVQSVREQLGLTPQAMDVVLTLASRESGTTAGDEFATLFEEFVGSFVDSQEGQKHLRRYGSLRAEAQESFKRICEMESRGEDITDIVLLRMLPYSDTSTTVPPVPGCMSHLRSPRILDSGLRSEMDEARRLARRFKGNP